MCLAVPGRITEIEGTTAQVDFGGVTREASLVLVPEAAVNSYVLVHAGFAIEVLNEDEAKETLALFRELARSLDEDGGKRTDDGGRTEDGGRATGGGRTEDGGVGT